MRTRYFVISILVIMNIVLIYKVFNSKVKEQNKITESKNTTLYDNIVKVDTLVINNWSKKTVDMKFDKPVFLFFFSKDNCQSCVTTVIDFLNKNNQINSIFISTDIHEEKDMIPFEAKFNNTFSKFNSLIKVVFDKSFNYPLPILLLIDSNSQVLLVKSFPPLNNYNDDKLFWERMKFFANNLK